MSRFGDQVDKLAATIAARRGADPAQSWSAKLLADPDLAAKKLAEEAVELALASAAGRPRERRRRERRPDLPLASSHRRRRRVAGRDRRRPRRA